MSVTISQLPVSSTLTGGDAFVIWANSQGDTRRISATTLADWMKTAMDAVTVTSIKASSYAQVTPCTVAALPSASAALEGARAYVTDSNATLAAGHGNVVAAGGANKTPVYCDGTNWRIG